MSSSQAKKSSMGTAKSERSTEPFGTQGWFEKAMEETNESIAADKKKRDSCSPGSPAYSRYTKRITEDTAYVCLLKGDLKALKQSSLSSVRDPPGLFASSGLIIQSK